MPKEFFGYNGECVAGSDLIIDDTGETRTVKVDPQGEKGDCLALCNNLTIPFESLHKQTDWTWS